MWQVRQVDTLSSSSSGGMENGRENISKKKI